MGGKDPSPMPANTREDAGRVSSHAVNPLVASVNQNCLMIDNDLTNGINEEKDKSE